ncbi:MAG: hypothetical protein ACQKBV_04985 [Puniceicoccales bacterium]
MGTRPATKTNMARKEIERSLPELADHFSSFTGFADKENRRAKLTEKLRQACNELRQDQSCSFYTMRSVSKFFGVPLRTVELAYEELEKESLLNRIWGSKTVLVGKEMAPRHAVRAVIGIPVWLHALVTSPYSRLLNWELEDRLRKHGFVADIIFFRGDDVNDHEFQERLLKHNLDIVIWHTPHPRAVQALLSLRDSGVRQVLIQPSESSLNVELPTYQQDWQSAYESMAAYWREQGITTAIVPEPLYTIARKAKHAFVETLAQQGLETHFNDSPPDKFCKEVLALPGNQTAVAFLDQLTADSFCNEEPARHICQKSLCLSDQVHLSDPRR